MSLYLSNHWLVADQRFRFGFAIAVPCVVLALAWRTIASRESPQEPQSTEKPSKQIQESATTSTTNKPSTVTPATNTKVTMRAPHPVATANTAAQAPVVPPKAAAQAPRYRRNVPEKKAEVAVRMEEERPTTPVTPTSKPKRKSTTSAADETTTPLTAEHKQDYQRGRQLNQRQQQQYQSPAHPQEPDSLSVSSGGSSEQQSSSSNYKNKTMRMGKNLKRAWSRRPFAGNGNGYAAPGHGEESILFPESSGGSSSSPANIRG